MSGVAVIRYLLAHDAAVIAVAPAIHIMAGDLPQGTPLPGIGVKQISSVPHNALRINETPKLHTDRVQVTVLVKNTDGTPSGTGYPGVRALLRLVLAACPNQRGTVNGIAVDSIVPDLEGPDFSDPESALLGGSRDFFVRYSV